MTVKEKEIRVDFEDVVIKFLYNYKILDYKPKVMHRLDKFEPMSCSMRIKINFFHSHVDCFPENLGQVSEEEAIRFHQNIKNMKRKYERYDKNILADC